MADQPLPCMQHRLIGTEPQQLVGSWPLRFRGDRRDEDAGLAEIALRQRELDGSLADFLALDQCAARIEDVGSERVIEIGALFRGDLESDAFRLGSGFFWHHYPP